MLTPPGLRPARAGRERAPSRLPCKSGSASSLRAAAIPVRAQHRGAVPALGAVAEAGTAAAAPAGEALPGLLTNGKAELRLDATECSVCFYTLKKNISTIGQG